MSKKLSLTELKQDFPGLFTDGRPEPKKKRAGAYNFLRCKILDWSRDYNMIIHPAIGYAYFVDNFAQFSCCACDKTRLECPCPESIIEVKEQGYCKCQLFWRDIDIFKAKKL